MKTTRKILVALFVFAAVTSVHAAVLVGHWNFDGDLTDAVGSNDGTAVGNAYATTTGGKIGGAASFDGVDDAITISSAMLSNSPVWSISFWSYQNSGSGNTGYILGSGPSTDLSLFVRRQSSDVYNYGSTTSGNNTTGFARGAWHHHVFTFDGSKIRYYVDGGAYANTEGFDSDGILDLSIYFGNRSDLERDFAGMVDDLQVYNVKLSSANANWLYNNPGSTLSEPQFLVGHWAFDGDLTDSAGFNEGTAVGNAYATPTGGKIGGAATFDGVDDAITISAAMLSNSPVWSISFWSYQDSGSGNQGYMLGSGSSADLSLFVRRQSSDVYNYGRTGSGNNTTGFARGAWHHHVFTFDDSKIRYYVDGGTYANTNGFNSDGILDLPIYLGNRSDLQRDFAGKVDDLQIYDTRLSDANANWLYNNPGSTIAVPGSATIVLLGFGALLGLLVRRFTM